jgi:VanZ family protein
LNLRRWQLDPAVSWSILAVYVGLIFYFSSRPNPDLVSELRFSDKLMHAGEYGVLGFLSQRAARLSWPGRGRGAIMRRLALVFLCGAGLAALDELLQSRVPTRTACVTDLLADAVGLGIGLALNLRGVRSEGVGKDAAVGAGEGVGRETTTRGPVVP